MTRSLHSPEYEKFRSILVLARSKSGRTQADVSTALGKPQSFVAKYEGGERRLDVVEFLQVCGALDIDPHAVIRGLQAQIGLAHD